MLIRTLINIFHFPYTITDYTDNRLGNNNYNTNCNDNTNGNGDTNERVRPNISYYIITFKFLGGYHG